VGLVQPAASVERAAQDGKAAFTSQVEVVMLNVTVTDPRGRLVGGLNQGDFTVLEDGKAQQVTFFASGEVPLDLELLIDTSSSMRLKLPIAKAVASNFLRTLRPADLGSVVAFADTLNVLQPPTSDGARLRAALPLLVAKGGTSLYTSLYITVRDLARRAGQRKDRRRSAVIVLTDGEDTTSLMTYEELLEEARRSNVAVYPILVMSSAESEALEASGRRRFSGAAEYALTRLAAETGACAYFPRQLTDLAGIYDGIARELATQYSLAYVRTSLTADSTFHRLSVRLSSTTDATLRTRVGFYAGRFGQAVLASADRQ
jgi:Ca-activated chloride channel homolog